MKAPRTGAQRQAAHKARMQAAGLVKFTAWVHADDLPEVRRMMFLLHNTHAERLAKWLADNPKYMSENG